MDEVIQNEIKSYGLKITSNLNKIDSADNLQSFIPIFQDTVVKILQFSSKVYQVKKGLDDKLKKENLSLLLKSLKRSIPELSQSCQAALKSREISADIRKQEILKKTSYAVEHIQIILNQINTKSDFGDISYRKILGSKKIKRRVRSESDQEDYDSQFSDATPYLASYSEGSLKSALQQTSISPAPEVLTLPQKPDFSSFLQRHTKIRLLIKKLHNEKESSQDTKLQNGKRMLSRIYEFSKMATELTEESPGLLGKVNQLNELAADFISMVIDYGNGSLFHEDAKLLSSVHKRVERLLLEVLEAAKYGKEQEADLIFNDFFSRELIEDVRAHALRGNFIGLADSICSFVEKAKETGKIIEKLLAQNGSASTENGTIFTETLKNDLTELEDCLEELINDIEDKASLDFLISKMNDVVDILADSRAQSLKSSNGNTVIQKQKDALVPYTKVNDTRDEESESSKAGTNENEPRVSSIVDLFPKAINDNDYRTVEILANRFLGNIKSVGNLLQKISCHSSRDIKRLRIQFETYFKIAGSFCSQARKAVFSTGDPLVIENLIATGKKMEEKKEIFVNSCRKDLTPWMGVSWLALTGLNSTGNERTIFANVVQRVKKIIETLSATEFVEKNELKIEISKISAVIVKTSEALVKFEKDPKGQSAKDPFLLEMFSLQWACAVICLIALVDKIAATCLNDATKMNSRQLLGRATTWLSMLKELAVCCTDKEASEEISEGIKDLELLAEKFRDEENIIDETVSLRADKIIAKRELYAKMALLTELTDILTFGVSEPMAAYIDPLTSLSFAPMLQSFRIIQQAFFEKMDTVYTIACLAVQDSPYRSEAHLVFVAADDLKNISDEIIATVGLSDGSTKEKIGFLKIRWRVKSTYLIKVLMNVPEVNYTAVSGVIRHLQSASHSRRYEELVSILNDEGSPSKLPSIKDLWKSNIEAPLFDDAYRDDHVADCNSSTSSRLDYPLSRDTDMFTTPSPRQTTSDLHFFRNYEGNHLEDNMPATPLIQTPETFNPNSSASSTRSFSSQDTEIFIGRPTRKAPSVLPKSAPLKGSSQPSCRSLDFDTSLNIPNNEDVKSVLKQRDLRRDDENEDLQFKSESKISRPIAAAARLLQRELEEWEEEGNTVITVVRQMTNQMLQMADYTRGRGGLRNKDDFINTAKAIAANANIVAKFAVIIADYCLDETCQVNLLHYAELVPTISTQLKIIASVKAATPDDETADIMLIGNAENLMKSVLATLKAAESASVKMRQDPESSDGEPLSKSAALTMQWKKKLDFRRSMESLTAPTNELGLKIISDNSALSLKDL